MGEYIVSIGRYGKQKLMIRQDTDHIVYLSRVSGAGRNWLYLKHYVSDDSDDERHIEGPFPWPLEENVEIAGELRGVPSPSRFLARYVRRREAIIETLRKLSGLGR